MNFSESYTINESSDSWFPKVSMSQLRHSAPVHHGAALQPQVPAHLGVDRGAVAGWQRRHARLH